MKTIFSVCLTICVFLFGSIFLVNCDSDDSGPDTTPNQAPTAFATFETESGEFVVGGVVLMDGGSSSDPDLDEITYLWEVTLPTGSSAAIANPTAVNTQFTLDVAGSFIVKLTVSDGDLTGETEFTISSMVDPLITQLSVAITNGSAGDGPVGSEVTLTPTLINQNNNTGPLDLAGFTLLYEFVSIPAGSGAAFTDGTGTGVKTFIMDRGGSYEVRLTATDLNDASRTGVEMTTIVTSAPMNITFFPIFGKVGDLITVSGQNFSTNTFDNVVEINGVAAAVTAATAYPNPTLTVQIASAFTTGTVSVALGTDVAVSADNFYAYPSVTVSTLAGSTDGNMDATGTSSQFSSPYGIAYSSTGDNFFVADQGNNTIRQISITGVVTTLAGDGTGAFLDGAVASAQFYGPQGIAVNSSDVIYIADNDNNRIRRINSTHTTVFTLAGDGTNADMDGTGTTAQFGLGLFDLVIDNMANIYVSTTSTDVIRKIDGAGVVTTFAGTSGSPGDVDDTGASAQFNDPAGLAIDIDNNIYVADNVNNSIRKITTAGVVTTVAGFSFSGTSDDGVGGTFVSPTGLVMDKANNILYIADFGSNVIRQFIVDAALVLTIAGTGSVGNQDGSGTSAQFNGPIDITIDAVGNLYVTDYMNHRIRKITFD